MAHYWARKPQELGHAVVLLPPHQVRPYVTRNKTDRTDAKGILEAYRNADIRPVPVKSVAQQVLCSLHRFRSGWIASRTAQINTLRGLLRELGLVIPLGAEKVVPQVRSLIADADAEIPDALRLVLTTACDEIEALGDNIKLTERQISPRALKAPSRRRPPVDVLCIAFTAAPASTTPARATAISLMPARRGSRASAPRQVHLVVLRRRKDASLCTHPPRVSGPGSVGCGPRPYPASSR
jgi:transposase